MSVYDKYLIKEHECECGMTHKATTRKIVIKRNAIKDIPALIDELELPRDVFLVFDENTYEAAGREVLSVLGEAGIEAGSYMFKNEDITHPDEKAIGTLMIAMEHVPKMLIAVGTGTINDLTRFCATKLDIPFCVVATAPSMDGFASGVTPITRNGIKISYPGKTPEMIIGDLDVLSDAPLELASAGFGDIIGKVTSRMDWIFGALIFGENFCPEIEGLVNAALGRCIELAGDINMRTYESTEGIFDALVTSGIAMQLNGNSRPASGSEHHISHFLEMLDGNTVRPGAYHGAKVGITSLIVMRLYEKFFEADAPPQGVVPERMETKAKAKKAYGDAWDDVLKIKGDVYIEDEKWSVYRGKIVQAWDFLKSNVDGFEFFRDMFEKTLKECGAPAHPKDLGYTKEQMYDAIMYARMLRKPATILEVLANWGYLEKYTTEILDELY